MLIDAVPLQGVEIVGTRQWKTFLLMAMLIDAVPLVLRLSGHGSGKPFCSCFICTEVVFAKDGKDLYSVRKLLERLALFRLYTNQLLLQSLWEVAFCVAVLY